MLLKISKDKIVKPCCKCPRVYIARNAHMRSAEYTDLEVSRNSEAIRERMIPPCLEEGRQKFTLNLSLPTP